jgi:hypothetical protein
MHMVCVDVRANCVVVERRGKQVREGEVWMRLSVCVYVSRETHVACVIRL